jgi:photosystem II stability/assembly factor-like uncharacterized protein
MSKSFIKILQICVLAVLTAFESSLISQSGWYPLQSGTVNVLNSISFVNVSTGYLVGNGLVIKTTNGGLNWLVITNNFGGTSVHFIDHNTGYVCDGTVYKTTNGGLNWQNLNQNTLLALNFIDANTGYAVGYNSKIVKTTNGGLTWEDQFVSIYSNKFNSVYFRGSQIGYIAGGRMIDPYSGVMFKTINGGITWYSVAPSSADIDFRSIVFPSRDTGYVVGGYEFGSSGVIYKSIDAGETWLQQGIVNKDLNSTHFWNAYLGYAVGEDGTIIKTTNGGVIWYSQISSSDKELKAVQFLKSDIGFTSGVSGSVQKTINGGVTGPPFAVAGKITFPSGSPVTAGIVKALKYNPVTNTVIVLDSSPIDANGDYIMRSLPVDSVDIMVFPNDEDEDNPPPPRFVPTYYTNSVEGTISWQQSRTLYTSTNLFNINIRVFPITGTGGSGTISGGVYEAPPYTGALQTAIVYAMSGNEFKGYSISRAGGPYDVDNIPTNTSYRMICDRMGYFGAERNVALGTVNLDTINFYMTGIGVIGIEPSGGTIPQSYSLGQNFPNPFNPATKISIDIPKTSMVKLSVYDMLGKEIEVLVNTELKAGRYTASWNASKYSSGIYFYRIHTSEFTDTRKMILVK